MISKEEPVEIIQPGEKVHIVKKDLETACGLEFNKEENTDEIKIENLADFFELRYDLCRNCENSKIFLKAIKWSEKQK